MSSGMDIIYIGRSHFRKSRANLIQTLHMTNAWKQIGCRIRLFLPTMRGRGLVADRLEQFGVDRNLDIRFTPFLKSRRLFGWFVRRHRRELLRSIVYTRVPEISPTLNRAEVPHHLEIHDIAELERRKLLRPIVEWHTRSSTQWLVAISHAAAERLVASGADPNRVHVAPSGVDLQAYSAIAPFNPSRLDRPHIVYLGRVSNDRGLSVLEAVAKTGFCDVTVVGDDDDPISAPVQHMPFVDPRDVPAWYARSDMVLLPYQPGLGHAESISPIKIFEAMAAGRPILASDLKPIREIISHERNGLLIDPTSADAWIDVVRRLMNDRQLAVSIARTAQKDCVRYAWTERARKLCECFKSALKTEVQSHL